MRFGDVPGRLVPLFVMGVALVSGCTSAVSGTPSPAEGPMPLSVMDPCALIRSGDLTGHGEYEKPERDTLAGARTCYYGQAGGYASDKGFTVSIGIRETQSADSVREFGFGRITGKLNGRKAIKVPSSSSDCLFVLEAGENSRVDIVIIGTEVDSCEVAAKFADVVEPRLPRS